MSGSKILKFPKSLASDKAQELIGSWKILIADDEPSVHDITKSVLSSFVFEKKGLEFFSAFSAKEALAVLKEHPDMDVILLDVVMESDDAGLKVVKAIRDELNNKEIRIILRTGQPGVAPEKEIIKEYDINAYKEKTELTADKFFTTIISTLRSRRDILTINQNNEGLKRIVEASRVLFSKGDIKDFSKAVLEQIGYVFDEDFCDVLLSDAYILCSEDDAFRLLASSGRYKNFRSDEIVDINSGFLKSALEKKRSFFDKKSFCGYYFSKNGKIMILHIDGCKDMGVTQKRLLEMFSNNIDVAFNNICLHEEIVQTQYEVIKRLGEIIESRSKETAHHVQRVANISYILAKAYGMSESEAMLFKLASPMHDIGKIAIKDSILQKCEKLDEDEYEQMKEHPKVGWEILKNSKRELLKIASIVAYEHHEKWDGTGYPRGLKGEEISIYGRITAVADVYDALINSRSYKESWDEKKVLEFIKSESGRHFDPHLVELFEKNIDKIKEIG